MEKSRGKQSENQKEQAPDHVAAQNQPIALAQEVKKPSRKRTVEPTPVNMEALRRDAGRQLRERLLEGGLSTADLLKVMAFIPPETESAIPRGGDWVLVLQGGEG